MIMKYRSLLTICCLSLSLMASAQASGGQITRKKPTISGSNKRNTTPKNNNSSASIQNNTRTQEQAKREKASKIYPIYTSSLSIYNVVAKSCSSLTNTQDECQSLRDNGYTSYVFFDFLTQMYNVLIYSGSNQEEIARDYLKKAREKYPDAWIMCLKNGRTYKYGSSNNMISGASIQTKPATTLKRKNNTSIIEPIDTKSLSKYNIVASSYSNLSNAQKACKELSDNGYFSNIYFDSSSMYRVLIYHGTNGEQEAILYRKKAREKYPDAWIMCVENGRTYRYNN